MGVGLTYGLINRSLDLGPTASWGFEIHKDFGSFYIYTYNIKHKIMRYFEVYDCVTVRTLFGKKDGVITKITDKYIYVKYPGEETREIFYRNFLTSKTFPNSINHICDLPWSNNHKQYRQEIRL